MFLFNGEFCEFYECLFTRYDLFQRCSSPLDGGAQVDFWLITRIAYAGRPGSAGFGWLACDFCVREVVRLILEFCRFKELLISKSGAKVRRFFGGG